MASIGRMLTIFCQKWSALLFAAHLPLHTSGQVLVLGKLTGILFSSSLARTHQRKTWAPSSPLRGKFCPRRKQRTISLATLQRCGSDSPKVDFWDIFFDFFLKALEPPQFSCFFPFFDLFVCLFVENVQGTVLLLQICPKFSVWIEDFLSKIHYLRIYDERGRQSDRGWVRVKLIIH